MSRLLGPGLYGKSWFNSSWQIYHAFNTFNVWTTIALQNTGCPIIPIATLNVEDLMTKATGFGTVMEAVMTAQ